MAFKTGEKLKSLLHNSGEDILISLRTGQKAQIKSGKITKIYDSSNHQELNWQLKDWKDQEEEARKEREKQEEEVQEHARKVASAAANKHRKQQAAEA